MMFIMVDITRFDMVAQMTLSKGRLDLVIVAHQVHRGNWWRVDHVDRSSDFGRPFLVRTRTASKSSASSTIGFDVVVIVYK